MQNGFEEFMSRKKAAKAKLARQLSLSGKKPLLGIFLDNELSAGEEERLKAVLDGISSIDVEVIILADSNFEALSYPHTVVLPYGRVNRKTLLDAVDIALSFDFNDVEELLLHGIIPVCSKRPEIKDYNPNHESGNGFVVRNDNSWGMFAAIVRAIETFKFPYDWKHIVKEGRGGVGA